MERLKPGGGFSSIVAPPGVYLAGPERDREMLIYADLDFDRIVDAKMIVDSAGHYARPDVVRLVLRRGRLAPLVVHEATVEKAAEATAGETTRNA